MREEFEKLAAAGKINRTQVERLVELTEAGFCTHRSWGFGKIAAADLVFHRMTIDFAGKPGHSLDLVFAADSLKPIPADHVLARKLSDLDSLRQMAALHHIDLIKLVLQSFGGKATQEQIRQVLVPDVIAEDWKKWWDVAKREMKKDGHFQVPIKKNDPVIYQSQEISLQDRLLAEFRRAKGLKARLVVVGELIKSLEDLSNRSAAAEEVALTLNPEIFSHQRTMPALAIEAVFARDELRELAGTRVSGPEVTDADIWRENPHPAPLIEALPAAKHKRAFESFRSANPENWSDVLLSALNSMSVKVATECANLLIQNGKLAELKDHVARLINQHQAGTELLLWLARERSDAFADILGPEVFRAMLTAMERDQFNEKKSNRLGDYVLLDQGLLVELLSAADLDVIKDVTRALQLSPSFDGMDKRSLLARIVKAYPAVQSLISGDSTRQEANIIVSWDSLERRKNEYTELVQKKIPANSKEIAIARSYGDLRENHEYKAAKEMQKLLMKRKSELETQLVRARGTDFSNVRADTVVPGTRVTLTELSSQQTEAFSILGAWDTDPEQSVISYLSPLAQALLNKQPGDQITFDMDGTKKQYKIDRIESVPSPAADASESVPSSPDDAAEGAPEISANRTT